MFYRGEIIRDNEVDTTSSAALSRIERVKEREKERRKKAFILAQKSEALTEGDGDFTEEDRSAAAELFEQQENETDKKNKFVSVFDLEESKQDTSLIESKLEERLIPLGKEANKVVGTNADNKLVFKSSTFPGDPYSSGDENKIFIVKDTNTSGSGDPVLEVVCDFLRWV
tara:strand:+ start:79 stop:588 length:510 start_codon:yes stop_codon:yes gene_type:complete